MRSFPGEDATGEGPHFGKSQLSQLLRDARGSDFVRARAVDDDLPISRQAFDTEVKLPVFVEQSLELDHRDPGEL